MEENCLHTKWHYYMAWDMANTPYRAECESCGLKSIPGRSIEQVTADIQNKVIHALQIRIATQKAMLETKPVWALPATFSTDALRSVGIDPDLDRWGKGVPHHELSVQLMILLSNVDWTMYNDHFCWKTGGDGDNGESLMYELDWIFELGEALRNKLNADNNAQATAVLQNPGN